MKASLLRAALLASVVFTTLGCGDPASPSQEEIAARFDALAGRLTYEDQHRKDALLVAAHTLRRGAPINSINIAVGSATRTFKAVAIQIGLDQDPPQLTTTVIAWRCSNADELLLLTIYGSELQLVDSGFMGNPTYEFYFSKGTAELWYPRSGEGNLDVLSEGATCQPLKSNHTCKAIQVGVDFAVRITLADAPSTERNLIAPRATLKGIQYLKKCETAGPHSNCWVSLASED